MQKVQAVLKKRIKNGVASSVCFVHHGKHPYSGFEDEEWARWRQIIQESSWAQDIFVVIFQDGMKRKMLERHGGVDAVRIFTVSERRQ
jgi:hypothetical protein